MTILSWLAYFLSAIGAINWGLTVFFKLNLVEYLGNMVKIDYFKEATYATISASGFYLLLSLFV